MAANPTSRVLALLEILQALPRASAAELAQRLDVTPRTVRRYIVQLQQLGVPVDAERGSTAATACVPATSCRR